MDIQLHPAQYQVLTNKVDPIMFFIGGVGCGKSFTLGHVSLNNVINYPDTLGLIVANTYTQLINATIPALTAILDDIGAPYTLVMGGAKKHITIGNSTILIYSLEQYNNIRGIEVGWICGDEIAFADEEAFKVIEGRKRCKKGPGLSRYFSTPQGYNWVYDLVNSKQVPYVQMKTSENAINQRKGYFEEQLLLLGGANTPMARQELFGEFVNQTAKNVYYGFDRKTHVKPTAEDKNQLVYVACDFNAGNMNYVAFQFTETGFNVIKSATLNDFNANTFSMAQEIYKTWGGRARIIPDSTARARKASAEAGITDIRILENCGLFVLPTNNPRIKDRQNTVNLQLIKDKVSIDPSCTGLIKELETLGTDEDEGKVSHLAVALGYGIYKLDPILTPQRESTNIQNPFTNKGKN